MSHPLRFLLAALCQLMLFASCGESSPAASNDAATTAESATTPLNDLEHLPPAIAETYAAHSAALPAGKHLAYDLVLTWGGSERFNGDVRHSPSTDRIAMTRRADGASLRFDGSDVAVVPDTATWGGARFAVFTWPYFAAAPYKLADPGTQWDPPRDYGWTDGDPHAGAKLTFASGTGDAPDDYYIAFPDADGRLGGLAYIVTFGKDADARQAAEPHAIVYGDYREVNGVPVAHRWTFYNWNAEDGLNGDPLGEATVSNVAFVDANEAAYATSGGALIAAPGQ